MSDIIVEYGENTITTHEFGYPSHTFTLVESVPYGYEIWNIGRHMPPGFLPLCRLSPYQSFPGGRNIDADSLKAIRIDGAEKVLAVSHYAPTVEKAEAYLRRHKGSRPGSVGYAVKVRIEEALPIMRKIKWR